MGVDYDVVGGVGVVLSDAMLKSFVEAGVFAEEEWEDDERACLDKIGIRWAEAGYSAYGEEAPRYYLLIDGKTLEDIIGNEKAFRDSMKKYGITLCLSDLIIIEDLHAW